MILLVLLIKYYMLINRVNCRLNALVFIPFGGSVHKYVADTVNNSNLAHILGQSAIELNITCMHKFYGFFHCGVVIVNA